ncbi:uncharacterized protein LOC127800605 isoform X2 [Diospyros lotus]|uniref:uncharacterized protein LOC127800605 isoform X2 n=1 Tax=Diospyros lotus TaxID=55363 RepID=UPI002252CC4A|nr:uncharacterized protein LOC127800605 isoform X2 [Diospyros lotus]
MSSAASLSAQFGDTTYTKVFVGGLAWETRKDTMKTYFEQFGEILEAVVITDKTTGKSKGYGFVTFREPEAAMRACVDAAPVIDGRRANCNLASLGIQRSKPSTPKHGGGGRNSRAMSSFQTGYGGGGVGTAFSSAPTFPHYAIQQGIPFNVYGYSPYSPDYTYPTSYYSVYGGGATCQYPLYGISSTSGMTTTALYPYMNSGDSTTSYASAAAGQNYGLQYPHHFFQGTYPHHYAGAPVSLASSTPPLQSVCFVLPQA